MSTEIETKRRRGRPPGPNKDDRVTLERMADFLAADPELRPTTALRRILAAAATESAVRRVQRHWKANTAAYLDAAQKRRDSRPAPVRRAPEGHISDGGVLDFLSRHAFDMDALMTPELTAAMVEEINAAQRQLRDAGLGLGEIDRHLAACWEMIDPLSVSGSAMESVRIAYEAAYRETIDSLSVSRSVMESVRIANEINDQINEVILGLSRRR